MRFHPSRLAALAAFVVASASFAARADEPAAGKEPASAAAGKDAGKDAAAGKGTLIPAEIDPGKDVAALEKQPEKRDAGKVKVADSTGMMGGSGSIYSDDWWRQTRPIVELHGFFRTRADLFYNFSLGHADSLSSRQQLFPRPADDSYNYNGVNGGGAARVIQGCGPDSNPVPAGGGNNCTNKTNASANMRFRIDPEIHISDNLRILSEIDLLDNLVLGSTPEGSSGASFVTGGGSNTTPKWYSYGGGGYVPYRAFAATQVAPVFGYNSYTNSVTVKRVWGEYMTPVGQIRFGRMPSHWGLGLLANSGDKIDSDYQSTADRIMFATGIRQWDTYLVGSWDFPATGATSASPLDLQGQPYNISQLDNVNQWVLAVFRRVRPDVQAKKLAAGDVVINGGLYGVYRQQIMANETQNNALFADQLTPSSDGSSKIVRIGAKAGIGDLWFQVLTKKLRWETEFVMIGGHIENPIGVFSGIYKADNYGIFQYGGATELEYKVLNDDLHLRFYSGFASGDGGIGHIDPGTTGLDARQTSNHEVSTFRFHPDYRVDLILFRNILSRVEGAYYFRPGVEYEFLKSPDGEKLGGRADIVYSRATKFVQWPGHKEDLGVEIDLSLYYQSRDGSLNDDPSKLGGFFAMLQYGVLFPLGGLGYQSTQIDPATSKVFDVSSAQIVRLFLGIAY